MSAVSRNGRCFSGEKQQDEVIKKWENILVQMASVERQMKT